MRAAPAPVAMATRGTSGPAESRAIPANQSCRRTLALTVPAGEARATLASSPHFPLLRLNGPLLFFLKGPLGDNDAGREGKSRRRMERGVRLHDLTNLKLRRRTGLYSATLFDPACPSARPAPSQLPRCSGPPGPRGKAQIELLTVLAPSVLPLPVRLELRVGKGAECRK